MVNYMVIHSFYTISNSGFCFSTETLQAFFTVSQWFCFAFGTAVVHGMSSSFTQKGDINTQNTQQDFFCLQMNTKIMFCGSHDDDRCLLKPNDRHRYFRPAFKHFLSRSAQIRTADAVGSRSHVHLCGRIIWALSPSVWSALVCF